MYIHPTIIFLQLDYTIISTDIPIFENILDCAFFVMDNIKNLDKEQVLEKYTEEMIRKLRATVDYDVLDDKQHSWSAERQYTKSA